MVESLIVTTNPGAASLAAGTNPARMGGKYGESLISQVLGTYSTLAQQGRIFAANAIITAPVIFSTPTGTGGPLLWNAPGSGVNCHILAVSFGITTVATVAGALGFAGGPQLVAPGTTTAIDSRTSTLIGGNSPVTNVYRIGTPTAASTFFHPFASVNTGALTTTPGSTNWVCVDGLYVVPPGAWFSPAGSATLSTLVVNIGLVWAEVAI